MRRVLLVAGALLTAACAAPAQAGQSTSTPASPTTTTVTTTTTTEPPPPPPPPPPPCAAPVEACVSLSMKQAWLLNKDGTVAYGPVPVSHGKPGHETPVGTFSVSWKDKENTSSIYNLPMNYSVFFAAGGIAFHEGPVTEPSHGCVHLAPEAAPVFFESLVRGDVVQVVS